MNFKDMWDKAATQPKKQFDNVELPEGTYTAEIVSCKLGAGNGPKFGERRMRSSVV